MALHRHIRRRLCGSYSRGLRVRRGCGEGEGREESEGED